MVNSGVSGVSGLFRRLSLRTHPKCMSVNGPEILGRFQVRDARPGQKIDMPLLDGPEKIRILSIVAERRHQKTKRPVVVTER